MAGDVYERTPAAYGSWPSPVTPELLARGLDDVGELNVDGDVIWWASAEPAKAGRVTLFYLGAHGPVEALPEGYSARSEVYTYGGAAWCVSDHVVHFVNGDDQRIYRLARGDAPVAVTPATKHASYGDLSLAPAGADIVAVRETGSGAESRHEIVAVTSGDAARENVLVSGPDFVWNPRISSDGRMLAWIQWSHPRMPWEAAELWVGRLSPELNLVTERTLVAGGLGASVFQPEWGPGDKLYFLCERTGWWNLYRMDARASFGAPIEHLAPMTREVGIYSPAGVVGIARYALRPDGSVVLAYVEDGCDRLGGIPAAGDRLVAIPSPFTLISQVRSIATGVVLSGLNFTSGWSIESLGLAEDFSIESTALVRHPPDIGLEPSDISRPEVVSLLTRDNFSIHAFLYRPANAAFDGPEGERPPLLVMGHGGPTDAAFSGLNLPIQFWTSRGFAVLDINYRGSTGFGRAYREALNGKWGLLDVEDCIDAAAAIVATGYVDESRLAIRGGSAGGFTTLCALAFHDRFHAGVSRYGVSDLKSLSEQTHKFESHLLDNLVGPLPDNEEIYRKRSPLFQADRIDCPVLIVQGLDDVIVPPNQAGLLVDALEQNRVPYAFLGIAGEGHGLRKSENVKRALEVELFFYSEVFGFTLDSPVATVPLRNFPPRVEAPAGPQARPQTDERSEG